MMNKAKILVKETKAEHMKQYYSAKAKTEETKSQEKII